MRIQTIKTDITRLKTLIDLESKDSIKEFLYRFDSDYNFRLISGLDKLHLARFNDLEIL